MGKNRGNCHKKGEEIMCRTITNKIITKPSVQLGNSIEIIMRNLQLNQKRILDGIIIAQ